MAHPPYIREKARQLRIDRDLTIDEIAQRLAVSRQTVFYWVRDLPIKKEPRWNPHVGAAALKTKYQLAREAAYEAGREEFDALIAEPGFRDFVCMYIGEGSKRCRNRVAICNSDPNVIVLSDFWVCRFARNPVRYALQYHADQDLSLLKRFWGQLLDIDPHVIRMQRKSNSNHLTGRSWRSRHGVLTVATSDTYFRARLQAWMERITDEWLDLPIIGA